MQVDLKGKTALITGAAQGIGRAVAIAMAASGANIALNDIEEELGCEAAAEAANKGVRAHFLKADVSRREEVERMVAEVEREFGGLDILVANAGVNTPGPLRREIHEYDPAEWRRVLGVDLDGLFYCCRSAAAGMVSRRGGVIVTVASVMGADSHSETGSVLGGEGCGYQRKPLDGS